MSEAIYGIKKIHLDAQEYYYTCAGVWSALPEDVAYYWTAEIAGIVIDKNKLMDDTMDEQLVIFRCYD